MLFVSACEPFRADRVAWAAPAFRPGGPTGPGEAIYAVYRRLRVGLGPASAVGRDAHRALRPAVGGGVLDRDGGDHRLRAVLLMSTRHVHLSPFALPWVH